MEIPESIDIVLNPCPWCKKTPELNAPMDENTWTWTVRCINEDCTVCPVSKHINIRNSQKYDLHHILGKLEILCSYWNLNNDYKPYERLRVYLDDYRDFLKEK